MGCGFTNWLQACRGRGRVDVARLIELGVHFKGMKLPVYDRLLLSFGR